MIKPIKADNIGAVLTFHDHGSRGVCGTTVGADGSGERAVIFTGEPHKAVEAAYNHVQKIIRWRNYHGAVTDVTIVGAFELYTGDAVVVIEADRWLDEKEEAMERAHMKEGC